LQFQLDLSKAAQLFKMTCMQLELDRDTLAILTIGADCGTIGTIGNQWQSVTSPCRCFRIRILS